MSDTSPFAEIRTTDQLLGKGGFGSVWLGLGDTGEQLAVKRLNLQSGVDFRKAEREYEILKKLDHPNIVKVHSFGPQKDQESPVVEIVMEYVAGGSTKDLLKNFGPLPELAIWNYSKEILSGLCHLHNHQILHMDLKPSNIMVTTSGSVKITDFGLSREIISPDSMGTVESAAGTYPYMSPGLVAEGANSKQTDIWAVGCTVLEYATNEIPWAERNLQEQQYIFVIGTAFSTGDRPGIPDRVSSTKLREFIKTCWAAEKEGISCDTISTHEFLITEPVKQIGSTTTTTSSSLSSVLPVTKKNSSGEGELRTVTQYISRVEQPCGELFRTEEELEWDTLWHRMGQLDPFKAIPFTLSYRYLFPLVRYLMCYASSPQKEFISYIDDFKPFEKYFKECPVEMVMQLAEMNKIQLFELNASTASTEKTLANAERGSMLIRPSRSNRGTLALSVRNLNTQTNTLATKHFFIMPSGTGLSVNGLTGSPIASSLKELIHCLTVKFPLDFVKGAGRCEIPKISHSVYSST
eukprot:TRINITY_DN376_c2_g1_i1.p1 TRINITY_DN376_c2_g1~~TRINITY_DN376_c2_g1_i1.p1  ORF type:complete len:543 (+),score=70.06 TRINITY_DN376_c2_g1_i1:65-1630(+)